MAPSRPRLRLSRSRRLKAARDFADLRQHGRRLAVGCLVANWKPLPEGRSTRIGIITSRKVGGAVQRNRARRLLREAFRIHQNELTQAVSTVLVARPSIARCQFVQVERDLLTALHRAGLLATA